MNVVGIDLGGTHVAAAVTDQKGTILGRADLDIDRLKDAQRLLTDDVAGTVRGAILAAGLEPDQISAIGLGLPGNIDRVNGICRFSPNFHWRDVAVAAPLKEALGRPVFLLNDVRSHTLGELHFGAGRGVRSFVMLALGTGIGGGIVLNGRLLEGAHSGGGEVGHITVEPQGPSCNCGNHGCIEALAGAPAIERLAREAIGRGHLTLSGEVSPKSLADAANSGNTAATALWEKVGHWLGIAIASIITTVDPERVLIGGGVASAGQLLLVPTRAEVERRCRMIDVRQIPIQLAELGADAGVVGAAALALESVAALPPALDHEKRNSIEPAPAS